MSISDSFQDLDPAIAGPLQRITEALRDEIRSQVDDVRREIGRLGGAEAAPAAATVDGEGGLDAVDELKLAVAGIDGSTSQAAILAALLEGVGRFASRAAFLLLRDDGMRCWGSLGFDDAGRSMQGEAVETANASVWREIGDGAGSRALSAEECARFCDQFGASTPEMGVLLPMSLGDRVAACLYADRLAPGTLNLAALQLLTLVAGQTLETLPVRRRSSTPTLRLAPPTASGAAAAQPLAEPAEPELPSEPVAEPAEPEIPSQPVAEPAEPESPAPAEAEPAPAEPEPAEPEPSPKESTAPTAELPTLSEPPTEAETAAPEPPAETWSPPTEATAPPAEKDAPAVEPETRPATPAAETESQPAAPAVEPPTQPAAPAGEAADASAERSSTQVVPPDDVLGPGWAFTNKEGPPDTGNEALQEEARRLARLLVTEIKLYNEEQVEQGRRSGDIYRRLREDIDRSRQIFDDRIDDQIRGEHDYFREALARILAGGDESLLGM